MRLLLSVSDADSAATTTVVLDAEPDAAVGEVLPQLSTALATDLRTAVPAVLVDGRPVDAASSLTDAGVRDGSSVVLGDRSTIGRHDAGPIDSLAQLRVVSGEGAGRIVHAWRGVVTIGSDAECAIPVPGVADVELLVTVDSETVTVAPADEATTATLDGEPIEDETPWPIGGQVEVGGLLLELAHPEDDLAAFVPSADGIGIDYNRPPRILPPESPTALRLPSPPGDQARRPLPILAALMPIAMAGVMAWAFDSYAFLLIAGLSPIMLVGNFLMDRRRGRKSHRKQLAEYREHKATIEADAEAAVETERRERLRSSPDPAEVGEIATRPLPRLWERRSTDPDHLVLRVGTATQPSGVTLQDPEQLEHRRTVTWESRDAPAVVPLRDSGVVGIAGDHARRIAQWAVAQLAVLQSPRDVQLYLLTETGAADAWSWMAWLPHVRPAFGQDTLTTLGVSASSTARRIGELVAIIEARQEALGTAGRKFVGTEIVVVVDGAGRLRSMPGLVRVLKEGPEVGVFAICIDGDERFLPEEATAVVLANRSGVAVRQQRVDLLAGIRPDLVDDDWLDWVARGIAPIRDAGPSVADEAIPTASRLLDVLDLDPPQPDLIEAGWALAPRSTIAVLGESIDGAFSVDLRSDGPHALIAGTTGSGKSELLQTLVASLAVANRPDEMTFVLVDYKGGAAFKDCVDLPHTVGMVTDLDTHLVERALESLGAELRHREHLLAAAGAKDLEDYVDLRARRTDLEGIPRLVIVIDEFASLARELPDFVSGLVNIAQRGRSLGIHLVLATQRPSGVVSPEIRANTNLRIALRVTDASESSDVIDAPDAGQITKATPGRAYVRLGAGSLVPFQAGRVGGRRPGAVTTERVPASARAITFAELAEPAPAAPRSDGGAGDVEETDLRGLVDAIRGASDRLAIPAPRRPWLPALPEAVTAAEVAAAHAVPAGAIVFGVEDHPARQAQDAAAFDPATDGHLFVVGGARSGRSQTLRTIGGVAAERYSSADLHLYGLDGGNGALLPLAGLPHAGAVAQRTERERIQRLLAKLLGELARRQQVLARGGFASAAEQRVVAPGPERLPHILVLLDQWEGFVASVGELDGGALLDQIFVLLREGASSGIHLLVSGDRQLLSGRIASFVDAKLVLRLPERGDYSLAGLNPRKLPDEIPPGRGFVAGSGVETQVALLAADPAGPAQAAALRDLAERTTRRDERIPASFRPFRVDTLPTELTVADALERCGPEQSERGWALVGVGGDELRGFGVNLLTGTPTFLVAGPPKSGRSTVLATMTRTLLDGGASVVVLAPRPSPLRDLEGSDGVAAVLTGTDVAQDELAPLLDGVRDRILVVDDGELLRTASAADWLRDLVRSARDRGIGIVLAGDIAEVASGFSGWQVEVRKHRNGMLLSPQNITDGDLIGARVPRSSLSTGSTPGRGLASFGDGELVLLQLPR